MSKPKKAKSTTDLVAEIVAKVHSHNVAIVYSHGWDGYEWTCAECHDRGQVRLRDIIDHQRMSKRPWWRRLLGG